jgi:hypothetical protein
MRMPSVACCAVAVCFLICQFALTQGLEPETGVFGGYGPPDPYDLTLRAALFENDNYRLCQLVTVPSFSEESAVYMVSQKDGGALVISRTLESQLWHDMMDALEKASNDPHSYSIGPESQAAVLKSLHPTAITHTALLDSQSAKILADTCEAVLLRVRYPEKASGAWTASPTTLVIMVPAVSFQAQRGHQRREPWRQISWPWKTLSKNSQNPNLKDARL